MLIPGPLLDYAGIDPAESNDIIVTGVLEKIELWSAKRYQEQVLNDDDDDFSDLAEDIRRQIEGPGSLPLN
jgi:DNA-binding transcriptional regulator/RsmH inhibitor MraZ